MKRATFLGWFKHDITHRGITGWLLSGSLLLFYTVLYFGHIIQKGSWPLAHNIFWGLVAVWLGSTAFFKMLGAKNNREKISEHLFFSLASFGMLGVLYATPKWLNWLGSIHFLKHFQNWEWVSVMNWVFIGLFVLTVGTTITLILKHGHHREKAINTAVVSVLMLTILFIVYASPILLGALNAKLDPFVELAKSLHLPGKWMFYGAGYTVFISLGGLYMIWRYKHNKYQIVRTSVVIFMQVVFAFSIPWILKAAGRPDYYFSYIWPLKVDYFYPATIAYQIKSGLPVPFIIYSFVAGLLIAPFMALYFGKRWYCSWVCGCGGLANTFGEPWRHLSNKSSNAWRIEKFSIHAVMILTFLVTAISAVGYFLPEYKEFLAFGKDFRTVYAVGVSAVLSGVIGVGLYPIGGTRVWCRFACPMAAMLGLLQKLGRFRIRVKKDMCISCGMCSKYCEMGIDVRSYAQSNESFTRASCVGCGLCAEVCPRGVLRLENVSGSNK